MGRVQRAVAVAAVLAASTVAAGAATLPTADPVDVLPAPPLAPLPASATTPPSGAAVAALPSTIPVPATPATTVRAGVAKVDATWHVGAGAGQYAGDRLSDGVHQVDPSVLSLRREPSYGIQSRSYVRALLVEGTDGTRWAAVTNDLYIPQDLVNQRVAQILRTEHPELGIDHANLTIGVSHSHTSPYYSAIAWGVWLFQDVFDIRFFDFIARRMADAVVRAAQDLRPVRMAAATGPFDHTQRHSFGPAVGDDGTPAGYPQRDNDLTMSVIRFDDVTDRANPRPYANLVTLGQHPEFLEGNNLLSGEWVNLAMHMADVATGATNLLLQNNTGTSEPDAGARAHAPEVRAEYSHRDYAQAERGARQIANAVTSISNGIGRGEPPLPDAYVRYSLDFPVAVSDRQFAPPVSHPLPTVSNCRTPQVLDDLRLPILGLPDCSDDVGDVLEPVTGVLDDSPLDPGVTYRTLVDAGIPIPANIGFPAYVALGESLQVHLQAIRLGDVLLTVCPCEQWADQSRNIKSRADRIQGNQYLGWDWTRFCRPEGDAWRCPDPGAVGNWDGDPGAVPDGGDGTLTISDLDYRRVRAQVLNDAAGWDDPASLLDAESEPADPAAIKGNYTHTELDAEHGYGLVVPVGMANDYFGYIATYREYQRGDHYRKALTGLGPHSSDWFATRLVAMGGALNGDPASRALIEYTPLDVAYAVDGLVQEAKAAALGLAASVLLPLYEATLPADVGPAAVLEQPESITRFDVTSFTWRGGNNYTDDPQVRVERRTEDGTWVTAGDMTGEVVVTLDYADDPVLGQVAYRTGSYPYRWTAHFEAFDSDIDTARGNQTPTGTYRFVVDGKLRTALLPGLGLLAVTTPYHLESEPFTISPWDGITVDDLRVEADGSVSFAVGPVTTKSFDDEYPVEHADLTSVAGPIDYPDSWPEEKLPRAPETGRTRFPRLERTLIAGTQQYCFPCTFRPWADVGEVASATVTVTRSSGAVEAVPAAARPDGRWATPPGTVGDGDRAVVAAGGVVDTFGEVNGSPSTEVVAGAPATPSAAAAGTAAGGRSLPATGGLPWSLVPAALAVAALATRRAATSRR